ncbi:hypothetical protein EDB87DRAFT_1609873 [Lactarius vividus]|nr:hypothetical protein EDB87DRAFT_1609873 [Lactarius vividus]
MSSTLNLTTTSPQSDFQLIFSTALKAYEKQTKRDLLAHPLASQLENCETLDSILSVLQSQVNDLDQARKSDERLTKWLGPTVNVLLAFSATLGEGVGLVFSPAKVIFTGAGVLLQAAKDVTTIQVVLIDIFERIENFFKRLETYTSVRATAAMTDIIVKIMVEVLNILAIATKEIKQRRTKKYLKKLIGKTDIEDALRRLDKLTQEEVRMATAQLLKITHGIDYKVTRIDDEVKGVDDKVKVVLDDGKETKVIVQQTAREATAIMQFMANNVDETKWNQWRQDLRKWLSSPDPSTNHIILCAAQHQGTAIWFFRGGLLAEWKSTGSLLWIHGKRRSSNPSPFHSLIQLP